MTLNSPDRRAFVRATADGQGILSARVRPGHVVEVIDVANGGVLVESGKGLRPGSTVDLQIETARRRATFRGRVLRCAVARLQSDAVCYRTAIALDGAIPRLLDEDDTGKSIPNTRPRETSAAG